jgi:hypothetical protein
MFFGPKYLRKTVIGGIELIPSFKLAKVANEKRYLKTRSEKRKACKQNFRFNYL